MRTIQINKESRITCESGRILVRQNVTGKEVNGKTVVLVTEDKGGVKRGIWNIYIDYEELETLIELLQQTKKEVDKLIK